MTDDQINRMIHEQIMGEVWHYFEVDDEIPRWRKGQPICKICGEAQGPYAFNPDYCRDWSAYGKVLEKLEIRSDWEQFLIYCGTINGGTSLWRFAYILLNPRRGCEAIIEFFGRKK